MKNSHSNIALELSIGLVPRGISKAFAGALTGAVLLSALLSPIEVGAALIEEQVQVRPLRDASEENATKGDISEVSSLPATTAEIQVNFTRLSGLRVGAPVFLGEKRVGVVSKVSAAQVKRGSKVAEFLVRISLDGTLRDSLLTGTVALISTPVVSSKVAPQSTVQLLPPKVGARKLPAGKPLQGFSSYQEYWSAGATKRG